MRIKHALACRRPIEFSPQIQPMIGTPGHGALPSGHSTESFTAAFMMDALLRKARLSEKEKSLPDFNVDDPVTTQLMRIAERMATNRTVAGVHFPVDSAAGMVLAHALSEFFVARFAGKGTPKPRTFDGRGFEGDFLFSKVLNKEYKRKKPINGSDLIIQDDQRKLDIDASPLLGHAWEQAVAECRRMIG
jgi:hypothetical protein